MLFQNDKVYAKLGNNQIVARISEVSLFPDSQAGLIWLKIAVRNPYFADQWIITDYPEPVWESTLTPRETLFCIPGLDR